MNNIFKPKLLSILKGGYSKDQFFSDLSAGVIVGIVALPLAIAFAIASGVSPDKGLITAIVAGFLISVLGGSRVQIGGPTGAFVVIVYSIVEQYGVQGLIISTIMAGFILIAFGLVRLGTVIKYIPYPLIVGFTSGIALIIFSSQIKDFFGLQCESLPSDFIEKWGVYFSKFSTINLYAVLISVGTILINLFFIRIKSKIPGSIIAILFFTIIVSVFNLPVETIETKFGDIPSSLPKPNFFLISLADLQNYIKPAITIALLGAIESLLSAVVADGMISGNHRSNTELIAQGVANIFSGVFGGIPATGAIARTVTNVKNGGRTPIAGMVHALVLLIIMLFVGKWAKLIPLSCLAGILAVVAYNMSEWRSFVDIFKSTLNDRIVLVTTFLLTVLVDLTIAIEVGIVLASFLFMRRMIQITNISTSSKTILIGNDDNSDIIESIDIPDGVTVYEINGPFFFGAANKFKEVLKDQHELPKVLIVRMRHVPIIDATGIHNLKGVINELHSKDTTVILSGVQQEVYNELNKSKVVEMIGKSNVFDNINSAIQRADKIIVQKN